MYWVVPMEGATSILSAAWAEVTEAVTQIMGNQYMALMITLPILALVVGIAKGMFQRKKGG